MLLKSTYILSQSYVTEANSNLYSAHKVTFLRNLHSNVHVTQMALAALDNMKR